MVIVTNGQVAVMVYSKSQWLDAATAVFPPEYAAYRVTAAISISSVLGAAAPWDGDGYGDSAGGKVGVALPAMGHAEVEAIATERVLP